LTCGGANDPHIAIERDESCAGRMIHDGDVPERVAVLVDVDRGACSEPAKDENGDYQIDETLLNNPPIIGKTTGFIRNHWLIDLGKELGVSPIRQQQLPTRNLAHGLDGLPEHF